MSKAIIKLRYRQLIDQTATGSFERDVYNDSYEEFRMQSQTYSQGGQLKTFHELVANNPKANSLHYKTGFAIGLYIRDLNRQIPGLYDTLGKIPLLFETHQFEIVHSDIMNKADHKVAVTYTTAPLLLLEIIGDCLLLAIDGTAMGSAGPVDTFMLRMQPQLSICSYQSCIAKHADHPGYALAGLNGNSL